MAPYPIDSFFLRFVEVSQFLEVVDDNTGKVVSVFDLEGSFVSIRVENGAYILQEEERGTDFVVPYRVNFNDRLLIEEAEGVGTVDIRDPDSLDGGFCSMRINYFLDRCRIIVNWSDGGATGNVELNVYAETVVLACRNGENECLKFRENNNQ